MLEGRREHLVAAAAIYTVVVSALLKVTLWTRHNLG